jgi:cytochrome c5
MVTTMRQISTLAAAALGLGLGLAGCAVELDENDTTAAITYTPGGLPDGDGPQYDRFAAFTDPQGLAPRGILGYLPSNEELSDVYATMTDAQRLGLATWLLFADEDGEFFRVSQKETWNGQNMLRVIDSRGRDDRFERTGLLNDPDCAKTTTRDQFGFYIDSCSRDPFSSGIIGLRLRPNPDFDMAKWRALGNGDVNRAADKWLKAPRDRFEWKSKAYEDLVQVEPPYDISMTCTICHAAPNPLVPAANVNRSSWKNIVFALGNQYFQEGKIFGDGLPHDDFLRQVLDAQHAGASDTSRMATDHIYNPNTINAIFNLKYRPLHKERVKQFDADGVPIDNYDIKPETCDGETCEVDTFRVLKDGADSSGVSGAALRVFINIGSCFGEFARNMDPIWGVRHPTEEGRLETPISRRKLAEECRDYQNLIPLAPYLIDYLTFVTPYRLKNAVGGAGHVKDWNDPQLVLGRQVFAEECATCHSSKQPESPTGEPTRADTLFERSFATWNQEDQIAWLRDPSRVNWFKSQVEDPAFFEQNYLSDDRRYPLSLIGSNSARPLGTNAAPGNVWEEYASVDYQTTPPVQVPVYRFQWGRIDIVRTIESRPGVGYLRTPSLWGVWTSAPYLANNSLGLYNRDPSVAGRLAAFQDGMEKLLGLRERPKAIARTTRFSALTTVPLGFQLPDIIPGIDLNKLRLGIPVPPGVPIAAVANLENSSLALTSLRLPDLLRILFEGPDFFMERLQDLTTVFDPIEDKGHEFGLHRTPEEKRALIELLKSL